MTPRRRTPPNPLTEWDPLHPTEQQINILAAFGRRARPETIADVQEIDLQVIRDLIEAAVMWSPEAAKQIVADYRRNPPPASVDATDTPEEETSMQPKPSTTTTTTTTTVTVGETTADLTTHLQAVVYAAEKVADGFADLTAQLSAAAALAGRLAAAHESRDQQLADVRAQIGQLAKLVEG